MFFSVILHASVVFAMENEPEEFRGIPWGADLPKNSPNGENEWGLMELRRIDTDAETVYCRLDDEVSIGGVKISSASVEYHFLDSLGFANVSMKFKGRRNIELIRKACVKNWGEPDAENIFKSKGRDEFVTVMWDGFDMVARLDYTSNSPDKSSESGSLSLHLRNYHATIIEEREKHQQK